MKLLLCSLTIVLVTSCGETRSSNDPTTSSTETPNEVVEVEDQPRQEEPLAKEEIPPISMYKGRSYSQELIQELEQRNAKRTTTTEIMTLLDAHRGEDMGAIEFRNSQGRIRRFIDWPYEAKIGFHETEIGEYLDEVEKGKKFSVAYQIKAYWFDSANEVVEDTVVTAMRLVH